ncbi:hypothetical protein [Aeromonas sp. 603757]
MRYILLIQTLPGERGIPAAQGGNYRQSADLPHVALGRNVKNALVIKGQS